MSTEHQALVDKTSGAWIRALDCSSALQGTASMAEMTIIQHQQVFRCSEPTQIHSIPDVNLGNTHFNWLQRAPL